MKRSSFSRAALAAARAADDKKARFVKLYDVRRFSPLAEYYLVATVDSAPHADAVEDEIDRQLRSVFPGARSRREGRGRASWRVLDYGGLVAHVMNESAREFFGIERLWESARTVRWDARSRPSAP